MKTLIIVLSLCLTACTTVPVKQTFPELPPELIKTCKPLEIIKSETTTLSVLMNTVAKNYASRHECATQVEGFLDWYTEQKKIFDTTNK